MKIKIREIHVSWRKGKGSRRKIVGVLKRTALNGITFKYLKEGVIDAKKEGFKEYPGFPISENFDKTYQEDNLDIFSLRLVPFERKDNIKLLEFWEAKDIRDKFNLLALTQGLLPTDNFEFLGLFNPKKNFKFVTDLAGLSYLELKKDTVKIGDKLTYEFESNKKAFRDRAVKIFKGNLHVGYIKNIHNNIFLKSKSKDNISLTVKEVNQNGSIRNLFVLVSSNYSS